MPLQPKTISLVQTAGQAIHDAMVDVELLTQSQKAVLVSQLLSPQASSTLKHLQELAAFERDLAEAEKNLRVLFTRAQSMLAVTEKASKTAKKVQAKKATKKTAKTAPQALIPAVVETTVKPAARKYKRKKTKPATRENLTENGKKVLAFFETALNKDTAVELTQHALAEGSGVPDGSIASSLERVLKTGLVVMVEKGSYKLA